MMKRIIFIIAALLLGHEARAVDLDELSYAIALKSPSIQARQKAYEAENLQAEADNALAGPDVDFEYKIGAGQADNRWGISAGQSFDWPGVYSARRESNGLRRDAFEFLYTDDLVAKILEVKLALIDLAEARARYDMIADAAANIERLYAVVSAAYERGDATVLTCRKTQMQLVAMRTALVETDAARISAVAALRAIAPVDESAYDNVDKIQLKALQPLSVYQKALETSVGMIGRHALFEADCNDISVAHRQGLPSFKLSYLHDFEDGHHFNGFGVGISLPSWQPKKKVKAAEARALASELEFHDYHLARNAQMQSDYEEASRLYSRIADQQSIIDSDYPALLRKAYDAGLLTIFEYLNEYNSYLETLTDYQALVARYARLEAKLAKDICR